MIRKGEEAMKTKDTWKKLGMDLAYPDIHLCGNHKPSQPKICWDCAVASYMRRARALRSADRKRAKLAQFLAGKRSSRGLEKVIREDKRKGASRG